MMRTIKYISAGKRENHFPENCSIAEDVEIGNEVIIYVTERLFIGSGTKIRDHCRIEGRDVVIGKNFVMNHYAEIGGGSCYTKQSSLMIGDNCHLGSYSIINTARPVKIGNDVGMGRFTNLYTHGAWLSPLEGFPCSFGEITIGNKVWIPGATILPNTQIGDYVVISQGAKIQGIVKSGSLVTSSGKIVSDKYPKNLHGNKWHETVKNILVDFPEKHRFQDPIIEVKSAIFNFNVLEIEGEKTKEALGLQTLLRRHGIRFSWKGA